MIFLYIFLLETGNSVKKTETCVKAIVGGGGLAIKKEVSRPDSIY